MNTYVTVLYFTVLNRKTGKYRIRKTPYSDTFKSILIMILVLVLLTFGHVLFIMIIILRNKFYEVWEKFSQKFFKPDISLQFSRILEYSCKHKKDVSKLCNNQLLKIPNWLTTPAAIITKNYTEKVFLKVLSSFFTFLSR